MGILIGTRHPQIFRHFKHGLLKKPWKGYSRYKLPVDTLMRLMIFQTLMLMNLDWSIKLFLLVWKTLEEYFTTLGNQPCLSNGKDG